MKNLKAEEIKRRIINYRTSRGYNKDDIIGVSEEKLEIMKKRALEKALKELDENMEY